MFVSHSVVEIVDANLVLVRNKVNEIVKGGQLAGFKHYIINVSVVKVVVQGVVLIKVIVRVVSSVNFPGEQKFILVLVGVIVRVDIITALK